MSCKDECWWCLANEVDPIKSRDAEIARLRAIVRVNGLRWGHSHAEIDAILSGVDGEQAP